jgi:ankyrin repeat protein
LVERLLEAGCNPNLPNGNCPTALFQLGYFWTTDFDHLRERSVPCLELLLAHGADVSLRDDRGRTVLHPIVLAGDVEAVDCLLRTGADPEACDELNQTPIMYCGTAAAAQRLLSAGALPTRQDRFGHDALDHAFMGGRQDVCDLLRSESHQPRSAALLVKAIQEQDVALVQELLESGVPVTTTDPLGGPALHQAARRQAASIVKLLLEWGADINGRDLNDETPLFACLTAPWYGNEFDLQKHEETLSTLLDYAASTDAVNGKGEAAIFFGYFWWNFQSVSARILASHQRAYSHSGKTALMVAVERGSAAQVSELIKNGQADVNASDDQGRTALHLATGGSRDLEDARYLEKAALLLASPAQVDAVDRAGETPLFYAISAANDAMVNLLLDAGADLTQHNSAGETAEAVALRAANADLANRLRRKLALRERGL